MLQEHNTPVATVDCRKAFPLPGETAPDVFVAGGRPKPRTGQLPMDTVSSRISLQGVVLVVWLFPPQAGVPNALTAAHSECCQMRMAHERSQPGSHRCTGQHFAPA
jgi:hypothetical protein